MKWMTSIPTAALLLAGVIVFSWSLPGHAFDEVNKTFFGVAIKGYDTVAYWTEMEAKKGKRKYSHNWNEAKWYFHSAENRDMFAANPERYAPQYGGH